MKESDIQRAILDYLAAKRVFAIRMNSGAMFGKHKGKGWAVRFGMKGMADILAFPYVDFHILPTWIEVKMPLASPSAEQCAFGVMVEAEGHRYILARSVDDVMALMP